jgi:hypothetical protein
VNPRPLGLRLGLGGRDDLDLAGLELRAQCRELVLVEVVLVRERLQRLLVDCPTLLRLLDEAEDGYLKIDGAQIYSLPSCISDSLPSCISGGWAAESTPYLQPATPQQGAAIM